MCDTYADSAARLEVAAKRSGVRSGGWLDLFAEDRLPVLIVIAGGVLLYAMNMYFTAALMPTITRDIGGARYYAWVTTGYVLAAIVGTMFVDRILGSYGGRISYVIAFGLFGIGAVANALSREMEMLIAARIAQGLGGGFLAGLGYAVIRSTLPQRLWARATGITASMWGVGALFGPVLGGLFGEIGAWRWAYGTISAAAVLLILIALRAVDWSNPPTKHHSRVPATSLLVLVLAAVVISLSSLVPTGWPMLGTVVCGSALLFVFVMTERRMTSTVLPSATYQSGNPLKWIYLTAGLLSTGVMTENFTPLFGQYLGGFSPLGAGILGAMVSAGWVAAQLLIVSVENQALQRFALRTGPLLLASGLVVYGLLLAVDPTALSTALWFVVLFLAGVGIGVAYPLLSVAAMSSSTDPSEGRKAAAGLATTQTIAFAITSALAGGLMVLGAGNLLVSAQFVIFGIAAINAGGVVTVSFATRR
jgi:MFS family permease